jgi:hypothetical protein
VNFPYLVGRARTPQPSLGGSLLRPRPIAAVRILGPSSSFLRDSLLDTGADDTIFPEWVAAVIGLDLTHAETRDIGLVGRRPLPCRYSPVRLRISAGPRATYEWPAVVGFVALPIRRPLLGFAGFFQFFDATFRGANQDVILTANRSFPGTSP